MFGIWTIDLGAFIGRSRMKAVILAAGKGTRMKELTNEVPKPMLRVDGKPILQHIVEGLRDAASIREFCVITGWKAEVTENYFGDGAGFGVIRGYSGETRDLLSNARAFP